MAKVGKRSNGGPDVDLTRTKKLKSLEESNRPAQPEDIPSSEEDTGHSTKSLAAAKEPRKGSKAFVADYTHAVEEQMQRLNKTLDDRALTITKRRTQLQASLNHIIAESRRGIPEEDAERPNVLAKEKLAGHAIYQNGISAVSLSRELMIQYVKICEQTTFREGSTKNGTGREDECEALQRILQKQGDKVKFELRHFLNGESKTSTALPPDETLAVDNDLWSRYAVTSKQVEGNASAVKAQSWAAVAKHAQRGVHRMVKTLPNESE